MSTRRPAPGTPDQAVTVPAGQVVPDRGSVLAEVGVAAEPGDVDGATAEVAVAADGAEPSVVAGVAPEELSPEAADLVRRLKRVQGQVGGLVRMVEAGRTSSEIITQLSAAEHALHRVGFLLVAEEMRRCARGGGDDPEVTARIEAAEKLFLRLG